MLVSNTMEALWIHFMQSIYFRPPFTCCTVGFVNRFHADWARTCACACAYNSYHTWMLPLQLHQYQELSYNDKISSIGVAALHVRALSQFFIASVTESRIIFNALAHGKHVYVYALLSSSLSSSAWSLLLLLLSPTLPSSFRYILSPVTPLSSTSNWSSSYCWNKHFCNICMAYLVHALQFS